MVIYVLKINISDRNSASYFPNKTLNLMCSYLNRSDNSLSSERSADGFLLFTLLINYLPLCLRKTLLNDCVDYSGSLV